MTRLNRLQFQLHQNLATFFPYLVTSLQKLQTFLKMYRNYNNKNRREQTFVISDNTFEKRRFGYKKLGTVFWLKT